ncbi:hypothetical protein O181_049791 [Austropuccinia psidii MF-1]|uniref:Uncharacterized protein n=1 Tax=Austropuccinia psidii MF-1 TaxID=1389203 RepID=A0A9Q3DT21_9BASI|nr:hypothetical protein [Austropuccinia psidii MF-1]
MTDQLIYLRKDHAHEAQRPSAPKTGPQQGPSVGHIAIQGLGLLRVISYFLGNSLTSVAEQIALETYAPQQLRECAPVTCRAAIYYDTLFVKKSAKILINHTMMVLERRAELANSRVPAATQMQYSRLSRSF